jgi:hypothetical protein
MEAQVTEDLKSCIVCEVVLRYEWQQRYTNKKGEPVCGYVCSQAEETRETILAHARSTGEN